ncbi:ABC transporter ATP-binding protein [Streptomyces sp. NPDC048282]|uniref:ABC transporter ATP-binding protein n=1 Tax=Streptomyces sp. NPDC048282 TaxID=3365528 RepID=UPI00371007B7
MNAAQDSGSTRASNAPTPTATAASEYDVLRVADLSLTVGRRDERRPLLDGVTLAVRAGETVGLVGESGSGKSLTCRAALGLFPPGAEVTGSVRVDGKEVVGASARDVLGIRRGQAAMVFQDPRASINPVRRIGDFLVEGVRAAGLPRPTARDRARRLLGEVGIGAPEAALRRYPHEFSGGMLQRVMIAATLMTEPRLLLADEATTALDVTTQAEVLALLRRVQRDHGTGTLLVTHDLDLAAATCDRVYVMYAGRIVESATSADLFDRARHPYSQGLFASSPSVRGPRSDPRPIPGRPLALVDAPGHCAFADRCQVHVDQCRTEVPRLRTIGTVGEAQVACHVAQSEERL